MFHRHSNSVLRRGLLAIFLVAMALPAAADYRRGCDALVRIVPNEPGDREVNFAWREEAISSTYAGVNDMRGRLRDHIIWCVFEHWRTRYDDGAPGLYCAEGFLRTNAYPFHNMDADVTDRLCAANPGRLRILADVVLEIRGERGCVRDGGNVDPHESYLLVDRYPITCAEVPGEGHADERGQPPIGEGGGWDCVGEGCGAAAGAEPVPEPPAAEPPADDGLPATATYTPLPNFRLPGNDLYLVELSAPNWMLCRQACTDDPRCGAWTYRAPTGASGPLCLIKSRAGVPIPDFCCRSGVRQ